MLGYRLAATGNGTFDSVATIGLTSDGAGIDTLGTTVLTPGTISFVGTLMNYATATVTELAGGAGTLTGSGTGYRLNLGTLAVGAGAVSADLGIVNSAAGLADLLDGGFVVTPAAGFTNPTDTGFTGLIAGGTHTLAGTIGFDPTDVGTYTETLTLNPTSEDSAGATPLAPINVTVTAVVASAGNAVPVFANPSGNGNIVQTGSAAFTLDAGTIAVGPGSDSVVIAAGNAAGKLADTMSGTLLDGAGSLTFTGLAPGHISSGLTLDFATTAAGTFTQTVTLDPVDSVAGVLPTETLTVTTVIESNAAPCYAEGTRIATETGERPIEELRPGDLVRTASGALRPVVWVGHRRVDCTRHARPEKVWPVRVLAGAFGRGRPRRDLWLSPDHAVFVGGVLIPVQYLVNGVTILRERVERIGYFHLELARHDILLAEGLPAESYLDTGARAAFANGGAAIQLHADFAPRMWDGDSCAPIVIDGPELARVRARLARRARTFGPEADAGPRQASRRRRKGAVSSG